MIKLLTFVSCIINGNISGSPADGQKPAPSLLFNNEAEEILKKQLAIEQEVSVMFLIFFKFSYLSASQYILCHDSLYTL